jgi:effector-binding domain-containing protein
MTIVARRRLSIFGSAILLCGLIVSVPAVSAQAEAPPNQPPAPANPAAPATPAPGPSETGPQMIDVAAKPTAVISAKAKWADGFTAIKDAEDKLKAAVEQAGLQAAGAPLTVFTQTDDTGFSYEAMLPLTEKPKDKTELSDVVKLGTSPSGKALKFEHHGPYDDIDSTYDLITAYLDEKNLESQDYFVEEYPTELKTASDPNLAVTIYVFIK